MGGIGATPRDVSAPDPPLITAAHLDLLSRAHSQLSSVRRAGTLAALNGWTLAGCAALCIPLTLADPVLLPTGAGLAVTAWAELRGRLMLRALDRRAPRWLTLNQLATFLVVLAYCAWRIFLGLSGPRPSAAPELAELFDGADASGLAKALDRIYPVVLVGFYGAIALVCAIYQGACAIYYSGRHALIERYLAETPAWAREVLRALGAAA